MALARTADWHVHYFRDGCAEVDINTIEGDMSISAERASSIDYVMAGIHWPPTLPPHVDYIDLKEPAQLVETYCSYKISHKTDCMADWRQTL